MSVIFIITGSIILLFGLFGKTLSLRARTIYQVLPGITLIGFSQTPMPTWLWITIYTTVLIFQVFCGFAWYFLRTLRMITTTLKSPTEAVFGSKEEYQKYLASPAYQRMVEEMRRIELP